MELILKEVSHCRKSHFMWRIQPPVTFEMASVNAAKPEQRLDLVLRNLSVFEFCLDAGLEHKRTFIIIALKF